MSKNQLPRVGDKVRSKLKAVLAPTKQSYESLHEMFDAIDIDGNGSVDKEEFAQLIRDIGITMTEEELNETFSAVDTDGNMDIDFEEFQAFYKSTHTLRGTRGTRGTAGHVRASLQNIFRGSTVKSANNLRGMFDNVNEDRNGENDIAEFGRLMRDLDIMVTLRELQQVSGEVDEDNSGEIDFEEFKCMSICPQLIVANYTR